MKGAIETLSQFSKEQLEHMLIHAGYAFASWRMPNERQSIVILSLQEPEQVAFDLKDLDAGFVINSFKHNHPISPTFIKADIVIREDQFTIHPTVSDSQLDQLKDKLAEVVESPKIASNKELKEVHAGDFISTVQKTVDEIKQGSFEKVVLSRFKEEELPSDFSPWDYYRKLCDNYANAFCSLIHLPSKGTWIGASPELLISDNQERFKTVALAGTKRLDNGTSLSEIAWTQKEIEEQAFVSRYIINCFKKIRLREFHEHGPKTIQAGNLAHLRTTFEVKYDELKFDELADQMLELLHPTSAVCGMPTEQAKTWISAHENYDRELYAGFLGPVNFEGATDLFVNLRCAQIGESTIRFYAGAGITEDSDPQKEFEETELKMNVLASLLKNK